MGNALITRRGGGDMLSILPNAKKDSYSGMDFTKGVARTITVNGDPFLVIMGDGGLYARDGSYCYGPNYGFSVDFSYKTVKITYTHGTPYSVGGFDAVIYYQP